MMTVEQVIASQKANVETLLGLTSKAFEGVEKIVELNLSASKAALAESGDHAKAMLSVKDAQELLALQSSILQPLAEKLLPTAVTFMKSPLVRPASSPRHLRARPLKLSKSSWAWLTLLPKMHPLALKPQWL